MITGMCPDILWEEPWPLLMRQNIWKNWMG